MNEVIMFKCGYVGIIGRPNVGKSTMLNAIIGEKIAAVTAKPQTTRNRITGILNSDDAQIIFVDTPGIHQAFNTLNRSMVNNAMKAIKGVEVVAFLLEAHLGITNSDIDILQTLKLRTSLPVVAIINKIDRIEKPSLLPLIDKISKLFPFIAIIPICAQSGNGIPVVIEEIKKLLPVGEPCFPTDYFTDKSERFIVEEIIREQIIL
ncbi:MAG: GTPase Era, partial [Deltaproteobacteria bacterium]